MQDFEYLFEEAKAYAKRLGLEYPQAKLLVSHNIEKQPDSSGS